MAPAKQMQNSLLNSSSWCKVVQTCALFWQAFVKAFPYGAGRQQPKYPPPSGAFFPTEDFSFNRSYRIGDNNHAAVFNITLERSPGFTRPELLHWV